jgi:nitroimidazol reductase NimA-like FMN-containing flavoprotein (pyridoxamine 5'-phosphate oxidase superfamily)
MRRADKQIVSKSDIDKILQNAAVCRLAFAADNEPYVVTMNFA